MININDKTLCEACFEPTDRDPCPKCGFSKSTYKHDNALLGIGSILEGRYLIGKAIGKGGFGITYLAYDVKMRCKVAIKEYYPYGIAVRDSDTKTVNVTSGESKSTFEEGASKFYEEARLVAGFNGNPNIVSVYDFFYGNDTVYFTMGYLEGVTLKSYIEKNGLLSVNKAVRVAYDICNALMATHSKNVLHRDISPDNIMICYDGTIKLLDFGAARQVISDESRSLSVILKQGFAPLEQYQKKGKQGPWTDIYSLGATIYYALTGDVLDDPMSRLDDDDNYLSNAHNIREDLWQIIKKATMLKKNDRYQDVYDLKDALNELNIAPEPLMVAAYKSRDSRVTPVNTAPSAPAANSAVAATEMAKPEATPAPMAVTTPVKQQATPAPMAVTMPVKQQATPAPTPVTILDNQQAAPSPSMHTAPLQTPVANEGGAATIDNKSSKKRKLIIILSAIFGVILLAILIGVIIYSNNEFSYTENADGIVITRYNRNAEEIVIPSMIKGKPVVAIGDRAFESAYGIKSVDIPDGVTTIGDYAFANINQSYITIDVPDSVTSIGEYAFLNDGITEINIPDGITEIEDGAFCGCELKEFDLPDSVERIGFKAFQNNQFQKANMPESLKEIDEEAFNGCYWLKEITFYDDLKIIDEKAFFACDRLTTVEVPNGCNIDQNAFEPHVKITYRGAGQQTTQTTPSAPSEPSQPDKPTQSEPTQSEPTQSEPTEPSQPDRPSQNEPSQPDQPTQSEPTQPDRPPQSAATTKATTTTTRPVQTEPVEIDYSKIFQYQTKNGSITITNYIGKGTNKLVIPSEIDGKPVTEIGEGESAIIPEGTNITELVISKGVKKINAYAFEKNSFETVTIPSSVTYLDTYAFHQSSKLKSITIPNSVTHIGKGVFRDCDSLKSITVPNSVTYLGEGVFCWCDNLESATLDCRIDTLPAHTFNKCVSLKSVKLPKNLITIEDSAFSHTAFTDLVLPETVTYIGALTFAYCEKLKSIQLPSGLREINSSAFESCTNLSSVYIPDSVEVIGRCAFGYCDKLTDVSIPSNCEYNDSKVGTFYKSDNVRITIRY